jgi:hypothetical protein
MRLSFSPLVTIAALAIVTVTPLAAQTVPAEPDTATRSLLAPRSLAAPPLPTPIAPEPPPQSAMPGAPMTPFAAPFAAPLAVPTQDPNAITSVPVPPPGMAPPTPPPPSVATVPPTAAPSAPIPLTPIPLALPPHPAPPVAEKSAPPATPPGGTSSIVATLPTPALSPEASPADFLRAARGAVAAGRTGEARSSLEMAQTRLLSRVVDAGRESVPSDNAAVKEISEALGALSANDRMGCLRYIEIASQTIGSPLD